ncbi:MAG: PepSY domain-containing protein, partial [Hyphomonadaceae bacterium]|nr:PepSY domain-containing protein [Hyphomonadaceae bacterium]
MFVALITGVIVHKKIFADFFTFRPGKGQRSWLDAHNVASVVTLPFQFMITWSGLIFLMFTYMPLIIAAWYGTGEAGRKAFEDEVLRSPAVIERSGQPAPMVALDKVVAQAQARWGGAAIASLDIQHPNDAHARIVINGDYTATPTRHAATLVFDGVSGELLAEQAAQQTAPRAFRDLMLGLHEGLFAGPALRALYVLSGLLGAAMIATGLVLWSVKRRQKIEKARAAPHAGLRLVDKLNLATLIGLPVAVAAYFWANRLLPTDMASRSAWEVHVLFLTWLALLLHASLRPTQRAWIEQTGLAALVYGLLPLVNALTTDRHLAASLPAGDWVFAVFDLSMLALGAAFAATAWYLIKRSGHPVYPQPVATSKPSSLETQSAEASP